jgi:hypothetical protein
MNSFWHVVRTYVRRLRFWIFGGFYLFVAWRISSLPLQVKYMHEAVATTQAVATSVVFAMVFTALLGLHLRKQFGTPQAHVMPGFFAPHFAVAVLITAVVWIVIPWIVAVEVSLPPLVVISLHAPAIVLLALVVWWPRTAVLLVAAPVAMLALARPTTVQSDFSRSFLYRFLAGELQPVYFGLLALGGLAYVAMAWRLARLSDTAVATSDDFSIEPARSSYLPNPWLGRLQSWRDAAVERCLATTAGQEYSVRARRIPGVVSWWEFVGLTAVLLVIMGMTWYWFGEAEAGWVVLVVGTAVMLFGPLSSWRFRLNALGTEFMWPASRRSFLRQLTLAMALDFCLWTAAASMVVACGYLMLLGQPRYPFWQSLVGHAFALWGTAAILYGISLATLRFRYWIPLFIVAIPVLMYVGLCLGLLFESLFLAGRSARAVDRLAYMPVFYAVGCALIGLTLVGLTYRRWLEADLT